MRRLEIALCVIRQGGSYLLQFRNGDPKIGGAGLVGFFGGKINEGEEALFAVCRELSEETSLTPRAEDIRELGRVEVISDHQLEEVQVFAHVFHLPVDEALGVTAHEGELIRWVHNEALENRHRMTTGTRAIFEQILVETNL